MCSSVLNSQVRQLVTPCREGGVQSLGRRSPVLQRWRGPDLGHSRVSTAYAYIPIEFIFYWCGSKHTAGSIDPRAAPSGAQDFVIDRYSARRQPAPPQTPSRQRVRPDLENKHPTSTPPPPPRNIKLLEKRRGTSLLAQLNPMTGFVLAKILACRRWLPTKLVAPSSAR
jgi:hypothetical protein